MTIKAQRSASWEWNSKLAANLIMWGREKWASRVVYRDAWGRFCVKGKK